MIDSVPLKITLNIGTHYPCPRAVFSFTGHLRGPYTGVQNSARIHGPCYGPWTRPVNTARDTGSVYRALVVFTDRSTIVDISTERVKL